MKYFHPIYRRALRRSTGVTRAGVSAFGLLVLAVPAAATCYIQSANGVDFGVYDVFSSAPNHTGIGSFSIKCSGGSSATVKLSNGQSNTFAPRVLRSGANRLTYNLYVSAARNLVWGDGTGGTSLVAIKKNGAVNLDIFGSIPAGQDAAVGLYTDTIIMTVEF